METSAVSLSQSQQTDFLFLDVPPAKLTSEQPSSLSTENPQALPSILGDDRFKMMFENPDYQVDEQSEEFRLINPIVSKVGQKRKKKLRLLAQQAAAAEQVTL